MSAAIRIENLSKSFGWRAKRRVQAVKNLNLEVPAGKIYGFLGPNGAGKSTTIRMMLDLIHPDQGDVFLFGKHVQREREVLKRVGSLVEGATFYDFLTGRRNLEVLSLTSNMDVSQSHINDLLKLVGMSNRANRRVSGYSTGMKQRLGIAAALLGNPDLVILDEPTNGLDPHGIREVRDLIRDLAVKEGKTVFLSSHILAEVEQICDRVAIVSKGEIIREGTVAELVSSETLLRLDAAPLDKAAAILQEHWTIQQNGVDSLLLNASREDTPIIVEKLVAAGIKIYEVSSHRQSLEAYFLEVTKEGEQDVVEAV